MRYKSKYTKADHQHGATRLKRVFSWLPTYIGGEMVWLETYEVLQAFIIVEYNLEINKEKVYFAVSKWVDVSKRVINE